MAYLWSASLDLTLPAASFTLLTFWKPCAMLLGVLDRCPRPSALPGLMGGSGSYGKSRKEVDILWFVWTLWASLGGQLHSIIPGSPGKRRKRRVMETEGLEQTKQTSHEFPHL